MSELAVESIIPGAQGLQTILQQNFLERAFWEALYPRLQFRAEAKPEVWDAAIGESKTFTRESLLAVDTEPLAAGSDPQPENTGFEQWRVTARQHSKTLDTNLLVNRQLIADKFLNNNRKLALNAGQTLNRLARNKLFCAYGGGNTIAETAGAPTASFEVASISGFTDQLDSEGQLNPVSAANVKPFTRNGTLQTENIIAAVALEPVNFPNGRGTLTISGAGITVVAGDTIRAADAPKIIYSGGGNSVDAIQASDTLTLGDIRLAVALLADNNVPTFMDGYYHCHLSPIAHAQLFADNEVQRLFQGLPDNIAYKMFAIGKFNRCIFYENTEAPKVQPSNVGPLQTSRPASAPNARLGKEIGMELINADSVRILHTIILGYESIYEEWIPGADLVSEAGVTGKVGNYVAVSSHGIAHRIERIRHILRSPLDRIQQQVASTWWWAGDFGVPSDFLTPEGVNLAGAQINARFKRAIILLSGDNTVG